ncbi:transcriptional regulator [Herbaspirillum sp. CF444]|uniref:GntR family transcriptional regulator n=1 Tax=Herbaspirillum sp. CF444 TaxID=1144319 RepID=UPI00027278B9|nr:GntR family transcriptional regulator [Herbaspirillum sp. CF444]EJL93492.1 transcriptional regulator [Herbaspirillum sp. CF444]
MEINEIELSATDKIAAQIRDDIMQGKLVPGVALIEAELTLAYSVSRNTLREAMRQVCREGLALHIRHRGVVVRTLSRQDVRDIYRVRRTLELQALSGGELISAASLDAMQGSVSASEAAAARQDWRSVGTHSLLFHQHIVHLLGSPSFDAFFKTILAQLRLIFASAPDEERFQQPWIAMDRAILQLLEQGRQAQAQAALADYLRASEQAMLDYV